jgi:hypothetical protein
MEPKLRNWLSKERIRHFWLSAILGLGLLSLGTISPSAHAAKRLCGTSFVPVASSDVNHNRQDVALDQAAELKTQLDENQAALLDLRNSDRIEYENRIRFMKHIQKSGTEVNGKPLRLVRVGFKNLSYLNSDLVTISHSEKFLEMYYREVHKLLKQNPELGGIVLHRYIEFYLMTTAPQSVIESIVARVNQKVVEYFRSRRSESNVQSELRLPDFSWKDMVDKITWLEPLEVSVEKFGLQNPEIRTIDPEQLFRLLITDGHIESTFKAASKRMSGLRFKNYESFEEWSIDSKRRANHLKLAIENSGVEWKVALKKLHELAGDPSKAVAFQRWLRSVVGPDHRALYEEFTAYIFDWQMTNFFQYSDNPMLSRKKVTDPDSIWSQLETLPENSLERRRVLLEKAKSGQYIIATDFKGLGLFKRMEQDRWLQAGLKREDVIHVFDRLNKKMHDHFNGLYNEIKAKVGPKKGVHIYVSGDDAFMVLPQISKKMVTEIEQIIANRPMRIDDIIAGADPIQVYSSGAVRIEVVGDHQSIANALAQVRDYLFNLKKQLKEEEERKAATALLRRPKI